MAGRMLSIKFGADTTRLERAMKRMRKRISGALSGSVGGLGRAVRSGAGGILGGALGGFAGGAFAGGIGGIGSRLFGELMDASPKFAQSVLMMAENLRQQLAPQMEKLAKTIMDATPAITEFAQNAIEAAGKLFESAFGRRQQDPGGAFSLTGMGGGARALANLAGGDMTGAGMSEGFSARAQEVIGFGIGYLGGLFQVPQEYINDMTNAVLQTGRSGARAAGYEGIPRGSI